MRNWILAALAGAFVAAVSAAPLEIVSPKEGATVPILTPDMKAYLAQPRAARVEQFADPAARKRIAKFGDRPQKTLLSWNCTAPGATGVVWSVKVRRAKDGAVVFTAKTSKSSVEIDNLEIACAYKWRVKGKVGDGALLRAEGTFRTEDTAPRLIHLSRVRNVRDLGGRVGLNGRRVRQGRVYRSAGLNANASKSKTGGMVPGKVTMTDASRAYAKGVLGIRTDLDLRSNRECYGMTGSPLGPEVKWIQVPSSAYSGMGKDSGKAAFTNAFRVFLDEKNYPIDFHCIAGADRTGSLAFILNALLGVDEEELWRDWEVTAFQKEKIDFGHRTRFSKLVKVFDAFPGATIHEKVVAYVKSVGFTDADIAKFRELMLEP
ncbi:MAG: tyrosine-protein phosphatase [Kiritimatiellae bacterium]|nr:tyrosine-protein phosphatase [Kiritimatiellia bacterium]